MQEALRKKVDEIIGGMQCPKAFKCVDSGFELLCKAKDQGLPGYLNCLEDEPHGCSFALPFGYGHLCRCPLRVYIAKTLGK
ncbi:MAG: hypothetical protein HY661_05840 [Betaproteobacteria bacterium]|nr:hypothetical protein [Betaproteobacteria bacterium]